MLSEISFIFDIALFTHSTRKICNECRSADTYIVLRQELHYGILLLDLPIATVPTITLLITTYRVLTFTQISSRFYILHSQLRQLLSKGVVAGDLWLLRRIWHYGLRNPNTIALRKLRDFH